MQDVAGAAAAVVGCERPGFGLGISRRHRFWSMKDRVDADS